jgi:formylglycine-generating enzyme required for sulfatase activity
MLSNQSYRECHDADVPRFYDLSSWLRKVVLLVGVYYITLGGTLVAQEGLREWVDSTGKFKTMAELVVIGDESVDLKLESGEVRTIPLNLLSSTDQDFVKKRKADKAKMGEDAATGPPPPLKEITNSIGMKLVLIPKGTFTMGSPENEAGRIEDEGEHQVTISRDYYLGVYEVTQEQYEQVMGTNPSYFQGDHVAERDPKTGVVKEIDSSNHPVEQVSWEDAVEFCERLSELPEEKAAGRVYRLPTEAEWEYACRAGTNTKYSFGDDEGQLGDYAWFEANSGGTHPVGQKQPNAWGLYDTHGNVFEWCEIGPSPIPWRQ